MSTRHVDTGVVAGVITLLALLVVDASVGIQLGGAYGAAPLITSMVSSSRRTAAVALGAVAAALLSRVWHLDASLEEWAIRVVICAGVALLTIVSADVRERREQRLERMTLIAETAQRALLKAMPDAIGSVGFAARYVSASEEALVGGDLYEVAATPFGIRVLVGDVRGKGLPAVQTAALVLGAFRQAAYSEPDVASLARAIDAAVALDLEDEEFVTAIVGEFDDGVVHLANCGHHPPVLVENHRSHLLEPREPTVPLGLGADPEVSSFAWPTGARLLFYTDGLVENRDRRGDFFPLDRHAASLGDGDLDVALDRLIRQLLQHGGRDLDDDMALVLTEHR